MFRTRLAPLAALSLFVVVAHAQTAGTISFSANQTSATGSLTPVLTWSTSPVASSCSASGAWSGAKFASGTETVARITANASYTLTCTWGNGSATVSWQAPTRNTNDSPLTDLASYKVAYGRSASALTQTQVVSNPRATSTVLAALQAGTWYFGVRALSSRQVESDLSNVASKSIVGANAAKTVNVSITPAPTPTPVLHTVRTSVYDVVFVNNARTRGQLVGTIALNRPCDSSYQVQSRYWRVTRADVRLTTRPRSNSVIARCERS